MWKYAGMYSDSSSTTDSECGQQPAQIYIPLGTGSDSSGMETERERGAMYQNYKGQVKVSVYINFGLLTVHVVQARHLIAKRKATCDAYIKVCLTPDETKRTRCKTEVVHDSNNPTFNEKFSFELLDEDVDKRLLISVWHRDTNRNQCEFLGCTSFGIRHMIAQNKNVDGWYYLLTGDIGRMKHLPAKEKDAHLNRGSRNIPSVNQDVVWMETHILVLRRKKCGYGFTINGSCPVQVCRIEPGSSAELAGMKQDDYIVRIDGLNVSRSMTDSVARVIRNAAKQIVIEVQRPCNLKRSTSSRSTMVGAQPRPLATRTSTRSTLFASQQPLCSSTPQQVERLNVSPWKPPVRRDIATTALRPRFEPNTHQRNYGWLDTQDDLCLKEQMQQQPQQQQPVCWAQAGASATLPRSMKLRGNVVSQRQCDYGWVDGKENVVVDSAGSSHGSSMAPPRKKVSFKDFR